ncbi:MAG: hypothetical protein KBS81_02500 [Spirochaetales bacterium]|nr:hypothetical protein [Candidatus Physcosoma equi]
MKKILVALVALMMVFAFVSCAPEASAPKGEKVEQDIVTLSIASYKLPAGWDMPTIWMGGEEFYGQADVFQFFTFSSKKAVLEYYECEDEAELLAYLEEEEDIKAKSWQVACAASNGGYLILSDEGTLYYPVDVEVNLPGQNKDNFKAEIHLSDGKILNSYFVGL